jgi:hypothetical protein
LTFDATGNLLLVGSSGGSTATAYSYTPVRDPGTLRITALSPSTSFASTPSADGGLELHGGVLFWTTYPTHVVGQYNPVTTATSTTALPTAWSSTGGLTFVPSGYPNAGTLLVSSFGTGDIYAIPLTPAGSLFSLGVPVLYANMPLSGTEGITFVNSGPLAGNLLVANWSWSQIDAVPIDFGTGLPLGGTASPMVTTVITNLTGVEGLGFDPIAGDLFISSYSTSTLYRVDGFGTFTPLASDYPAVSAGGGATVHYYVRAGSANANRPFALAASVSGTLPGTQIGLINVPLNVDFVTDFVITNWNTPLFTNFFGTTNQTGAAVATLNIPPIILGSAIDVDFAGALLNPVDFATNAVHLTILP